MIDAFYTVSFESNFGVSGTGVSVFQDGKVFGGDSMMSYIGKYAINANEISGNLIVGKHSNRTDMLSAVFLGNFHLDLNGQINGNEIILSGCVTEDLTRTITIRATKHSDL